MSLLGNSLISIFLQRKNKKKVAFDESGSEDEDDEAPSPTPIPKPKTKKGGVSAFQMLAIEDEDDDEEEDEKQVRMTRRICIWFSSVLFCRHYIDGFVQDCSISSALALEILQSCAINMIISHFTEA